MNQGVWEILDPNFRPPPPGTDAHELYKRQSTFLYNVFQIKLKNDIGKTLVTNYLDTRDSRRLYADLVTQMENSMAARIDASNKLSWITNYRLKYDPKYTLRQSLLNWSNKVKDYNRIQANTGAELSDDLSKSMLINMILTIKEMSEIHTQELLFIKANPTHPNGSSYMEYLSIAQILCEKLDAAHKSKMRCKQANLNEFNAFLGDSFGDNYYDDEYDVNNNYIDENDDMTEDNYELFRTHTGAPDNGPKLSKSFYLQLGNHAKEAWRSLPAKDKQLIMDGSRKSEGLNKQMKTPPTTIHETITDPVKVHATHNKKSVNTNDPTPNKRVAFKNNNHQQSEGILINNLEESTSHTQEGILVNTWKRVSFLRIPT